MSGLNAAALQIGGAAMATAIAYVQVHSAVPNTSGSNECTSARLASGITSSGGVLTMPSKSFTGIASNGAVGYLGFWSALTGGIFYGYEAITGDATANAAGQYTVSAGTVTPSAT